MLNDKELQLLDATFLFGGQRIEEVDRILQRCQVKRFEAGETLYKAGNEMGYIYVILEGVVQLVRGNNPNHAILCLRQSGDTLGLMAHVCRQRQYATAKSVRTTKVLSVPGGVLALQMEDNPKVREQALQKIASNTLDIVRHFERLQQLQTTERLADYLLYVAADELGSTELTLPCDKGLIAAYLGMERESFSRALSKLRSVGVESRGRKVALNNIRALRQLRDSANAAAA